MAGPVDTIWPTLTGAAVGAFDGIADAGRFLAPTASSLIETLIALVVAVVAVPALRDIAARPEDEDVAQVQAIARQALTLPSDDRAAELRRLIPGMTTELALRRLAGIIGQVIAALASVLLTVNIAVLIRGQWSPADETALPGATATVLVTPILIAIAVVAGLYRVDPARARLRRLLAFLLDERATRSIASKYNPNWSPVRAGWVL